jgi:hypothetical protein
MPRTTLKIQASMRSTPRSIRLIWTPLNLEHSTHPQVIRDRQTVLDLIRDVYDPLLIPFLAAGGTWNRQFVSRTAGVNFQEQIIARINELPAPILNIAPLKTLGLCLFDLLRYYRFTDPAWRVPLPATAAAPAPAPAPAPQADSRRLDALSAVASDVLALDLLAEAARVVDAASPTYRLRKLADVASRAAPLPHAPNANPGTEKRKRDRDDDNESGYEGPARKRHESGDSTESDSGMGEE